MSVSVFRHMHVCAGAYEDQKTVLHLLELELWVVLSHLTYIRKSLDPLLEQ